MKTRIAALTSALALTLTACTGTPTTLTPPANTTTNPVEKHATPTKTTPTIDPTAPGFTITLKTLNKQCFGQAGCNLTVEPHINFAGKQDILNGATCRFIYDINGLSDGPQTQNITLRGTQYTSAPIFLTTTKTNTELTTTITDVTC